MIKTLVFNIESISDMQKILKIRSRGDGSGSSHSVFNNAITIIPVNTKKRSIVEDLQNNRNIEIKKVIIAGGGENARAQAVPSKNTIPIEKLKTPSPKVNQNVELISTSKVKSPESQKRWICTTCTFICAERSQLTAHLKSCKPPQGLQKQKCFCEAVLNSHPDFLAHMDSEHSQNKGVCNICKKTFPSISHLQNHMIAVHKKSTTNIRPSTSVASVMKRPESTVISKSEKNVSVPGSTGENNGGYCS